MSPGLSVAHYRITVKLGEGGMGEVWRATDTKLNRDVAVKVLPDAFAADPDRLTRFTREAQVLASLNHPNIAAIYGVEDRALVLELVDGATLDERIAAGPIPIEEALGIARQIAEALEYAHEKGIIHRDLKPANVKITPEGRVKVLDFGLAKAMASDVPGTGRPEASPTLTMRATMAGVILGTAAYMSPEQARGQEADQRADIWSFGVLVYEMLTGRKLFDAATVSDSLAAVLRADLDWSALPAGLPTNIRTMLRRCLERDPKRRLRDIWAARIELEQPATEETAPVAVAAPRRSPLVSWILAAVMTVVAAAVTAIHLRESPPAAAPLMRFDVFPPEKGRFNTWIGVSPDGRNLGFTATGADGVPRVWVRPIDSLQARVLPGTDGTATFFWSPDSRFVVFQSAGKLKKIDVSGGPPQTLCDGVGLLLGGSWNTDGVILFGGNTGPILRVSAASGAASPVTKLEQGRDETIHTDPIFLPDGRHFLYLRRSGRAENAGIYVGSIDVKPEQQSLKRIQAADFSFGYAPPRNGSTARLLFLREESLMAQAFDERRFEVAGEPAPIAEQVRTSFSRALFSVSLKGVLAYRGGSGASSQLTWFDREGHNLGRTGEPGDYQDVSLSKDASRVAYSRPSQGGDRQIWTLDIARGINTRLSFRPDGSRTPVWSSDGKYVAFSSGRGNAIYVKDAGNSGSERPVLQTGMAKFVNDWSLDGRYLLYTETSTGLDLFALPDPLGAGERKPIPVANSGFNESQGQFSPDGRWVAYASDESGRHEIYVVPFPPGDGRTSKSLVSSAGGLQPRWRADGKELYYLGLDGSVMAVDTKTAPAFQAATPHALFRSPTIPYATNIVHRYDATRDGKKFLMVNVLVGELSSPVTVVLNWDTGLNK
jgi:serine/threonine protein kinase/Tol biopolymer transport system component